MGADMLSSVGEKVGRQIRGHMPVNPGCIMAKSVMIRVQDDFFSVVHKGVTAKRAQEEMVGTLLLKLLLMRRSRRRCSLALLVQKYLLTGTKVLAYWYRSTNTDT